MAITIPDKAYLSFSLRQCVTTLHRIARQLEMHWDKLQERETSLKHLKSNLETLTEHEEEAQANLAKELLELYPHDQSEETLTRFIMKLERELEFDIREGDFLITTVDSDEVKQKQEREIHLVLDNLRSSFNVGTIIRSAEAFGATTIHLCGYTPTPENSKTAKSSLGAENWVEWKYWENTLECLDDLKEKGVNLYALETEASATSLENVKCQFPCALVFGNERFGLSQNVLKRVDEIVEISLYGKKNSLNVGMCLSIALNHFANG